MAPKLRTTAGGSDSLIIAQATTRAAERLRIKNTTLARIIGVSEATVSRLKQGRYPLDSAQKSFELAVLFVRLFRSLDSITGGDEKIASAWLLNDNANLNGKPIDLIQTISGLGHVIAYLDARRLTV